MSRLSFYVFFCSYMLTESSYFSIILYCSKRNTSYFISVGLILSTLMWHNRNMLPKTVKVKLVLGLYRFRGYASAVLFNSDAPGLGKWEFWDKLKSSWSWIFLNYLYFPSKYLFIKEILYAHVRHWSCTMKNVSLPTLPPRVTRQQLSGQTEAQIDFKNKEFMWANQNW